MNISVLLWISLSKVWQYLIHSLGWDGEHLQENSHKVEVRARSVRVERESNRYVLSGVVV